MHRLFFALTIACLGCTGGGGNGNPDVCAPYQPPSGTSLTTPVVSFSNDVLPIFKTSCGLSSSCHGTPNGARVFLGSSNVPTDAHAVRRNVVGVPSIDLPAMPLVTSGNTDQSFLLHKLDGDQCTLNAQCTAQDCGTSMPQTSDVLDPATRLVVRRWIAQGAADN